MESVIKILSENSYQDIKKYSGRRIAVLTDLNRLDVIADIERLIPDAKYDSSPIPQSSLGRIVCGKNTVLVKPKSKQGDQSAGIGNELLFIDIVKQMIRDNGGQIDITFKAANRTFDCEGVYDVIECGRDVMNNKKADVILRGSRDYPISIKMDNASFWESADKRLGKRAMEGVRIALERGDTSLEDCGGYYRMINNVAIELTQREKIESAFGTDLLNNGAIIKRTFSMSDFSIENGRLIVCSSHIVSDPSHLDGANDVWIVVRNDKTRRSKIVTNGLRVCAVYPHHISRKSVVITLSDIEEHRNMNH